jgi:uncharacterized protein YecE (DUF72 family)
VLALKEYLIGTGGWAYFHIPRLNPLVAYSRAFNFVEVNSSFYQIPPLKQVEQWRKLVPADFQFSVRAHRSITRTEKLQPTENALETWKKMEKICNALKSTILLLQTPKSLTSTQTLATSLRNLMSSVHLGNLRPVLEIRGINPSKLPPQVSRVMQDHNMAHCVDVSRNEMPAYESDILYTRLFGKGMHNVYQPTDEELTEIDKKVSSTNAQKKVMSFHFVKMYKDAARLKIYKQTGKFPKITSSTGLLSLEEILREDASFPATKQELVERQGWKLFDLTDNRRVHAAETLQKLPEGTYSHVKEVLEALTLMQR